MRYDIVPAFFVRSHPSGSVSPCRVIPRYRGVGIAGVVVAAVVGVWLHSYWIALIVALSWWLVSRVYVMSHSALVDHHISDDDGDEAVCSIVFLMTQTPKRHRDENRRIRDELARRWLDYHHDDASSRDEFLRYTVDLYHHVRTRRFRDYDEMREEDDAKRLRKEQRREQRYERSIERARR